jgi:Flp pilus assembly protein TadG
VTEPPNAPPARARPGSRRDDRGSLTLWSLAICVALLAFGGVTVDFWRAISGWRRLAAAGASGIDEAHYRATGEVVLDRDRAERLARRSLAAQLDDREITGIGDVEVDGDQITVQLQGDVELLLPQLAGDADGITMSVTATADPRIVE